MSAHDINTEAGWDKSKFSTRRRSWMSFNGEPTIAHGALTRTLSRFPHLDAENITQNVCSVQRLAAAKNTFAEARTFESSLQCSTCSALQYIFLSNSDGKYIAGREQRSIAPPIKKGSLDTNNIRMKYINDYGVCQNVLLIGLLFTAFAGT